jgi:glycosyltransferase involved in cell wall biosynthesis
MNNFQRETNFVSAVVYLHNCETMAESFLNMVYEQLIKHFMKFEIICVDDCSTDATRNKVMAMSKIADNTKLNVIHLSYYHGLENAMLAGVDLAIGDFVFEFDSTHMDYSAELMMAVYFRALQGYDVVGAVPKGKMRRSSSLFYSLFNRFSNAPYQLQTERFRIISRRVINRIHDLNSVISHRKVAYVTSGLKNDSIQYEITNEEPVYFDAQTRRLRRNVAVNSMVLFTDFAYRISLLLSIIMAVFALAVSMYTLIIYITGQPVAGWTTTMMFLSIAFFGMFVILTFLIKYVSIAVNIRIKLKNYSYESVEKVSGL